MQFLLHQLIHMILQWLEDIYNDPKTCNVNWNKSRYNLIEGYESFEKILNKNENGLSKSLWGPQTWDVLHAMSFAYPSNPSMKQKVDAWNFFNSLSTMYYLVKCVLAIVKNLLLIILQKLTVKMN